MEYYHVTVGLSTLSGRFVDMDRLDRAGGDLVTLGPSMSFAEDGPELDVTVAVAAENPAEALREGHSTVVQAFDSVGEPVVFGQGSVFTVEEFDRISRCGLDLDRDLGGRV